MKHFPAALIAIAYVLTSRSAFAQMDMEDEIRSLAGVTEIGLVVDIESTLPDGVAGLDNAEWRESIAGRFRDLSGESPSIAIDPTRDTHLYVHVNAMSVGENLVPFAIEASFVQMVRVERGRRMMAITWESGLVGLVTRNEMRRIMEAGLDVIDEFVADLQQAKLPR